MDDKIIYLRDRREPWGEDDYKWTEDYLDLWIAVLRLSLEDYWRGIRQGQHLRLLSGDPIVFRSRHDAEGYRNWYFAGHWLLSDSTEPRSCKWLLSILRLDHQAIMDRMLSPPVRTKQQIFEEDPDA